MPQDYEGLLSLIASVRRRWRRVAISRGVIRGALAGTVLLAAAVLMHQWLQPRGVSLVALWLVAWTAAIVVLLAAVAGPWRRRPGDAQVARFIEERSPELDDTLATAVLHGRDGSPMSEALLRDAATRAAGLDVDTVIDGAMVRRTSVRAAVASAAYVLVGALALAPAGQAARTLLLLVFPHRLQLEVMPGDVKVRSGESIRIVARVAGDGAIVPVLRTDAGGEWQSARMNEGTGGFAASVEGIEQDFRYVVAAAGVASREYTVTVIHPPAVERIDLHYDYPASFGLAPRDEPDGGDIYGPAGTRVRVTVHPNKPVPTAALTLGGGSQVALVRDGDALHGELTIGGDDSYRVALTDEDGLSSPGDTEYFIRTLQDRPPDVRIARPGQDRQVTSVDEVTVEASADDDFGIAAFDLVYSVGGGAPKVLPFSRAGSPTAVTGSRTLYLEELGVRPGDVVAYYARARDVSRGKRPSEARSDIFFLEVTPFDAEFVASDSMGAGGGDSDGLSLEELIQGQKDIITATWNLDRRARESGARSLDDIRVVARGQRELHGRAVRVLADMQRADVRRRRLAAGRGGSLVATGAPMAEAVGRAAAAMEGAAEQLDRPNTSDALPLEMTSLNELLRAQAEVRRREVQRQQANGAGGGLANRSQQDMSALFDQELARQQQTSYERPPAAESREPRGAPDEALDRIGELARRQEALNRDQQELSRNTASMSPEERKRELERLAREQSELRRQADELAREMQQRASRGAGGRGGSESSSSGGSQQASQNVQQASEDMQGATSELRRENPRQASERGSRAIERLREAEQELRGQGPDERRRALGDLQMESRQLAEAERRLGSEAGSAARGTVPADRARQRAAEQDRLADRAERLEQGVRRLAESPGADGRDGAAVRQAVEQMAQQRVSERMRAAAGQDREAARQGEGRGGARGGAQEPAESGALSREREQIARALDDLADRLGTAGGQDQAADRLAQELSRIRRQREDLAALDRQVSAMRESAGSQSAQAGRGRQSGGGAQGQGAGTQAAPWEGVRELLDGLRRDDPQSVPPEADGFNPGRSAPGTEAWKQDFARWDELKVQISTALERAERTIADRVRAGQAQDRLTTGASQQVPDRYRRVVEEYFRSLAAEGNAR